MTILGLDPGIAITGYAVIRKDLNGKLRVLEFGVIETKKTKTLPERLAVLSQDTDNLLNNWHPQLAVVESLYFSANVKTAINVAQARGALLLTLQKRKVNILELTPLQVKSKITGYGKADKRQVQNMLKKILKLRSIPRPDDAADALALAICGS